MSVRNIAVALIFASIPGAQAASASAADSQIRLNTIGFLPDSEKKASIAAPSSDFSVVRISDKAKAFEGKVAEPITNADTGEAAYLRDFETRAKAQQRKVDGGCGWANVKNLGMYTYILSKRPGRDAALIDAVRKDLLAAADGIVQTRNAHGYARPFGTRYFWGANGDTAQQVQTLQVANMLSPKADYFSTALDAVGYLFGRNYYGRSFVTGLGHKPPMFPHDRRSAADGIAEPWPGYLIGGGWPKATDWLDKQESYQTNEIAINWNGALIYALAGFVEPGSNR